MKELKEMGWRIQLYYGGGDLLMDEFSRFKKFVCFFPLALVKKSVCVCRIQLHTFNLTVEVRSTKIERVKEKKRERVDLISLKSLT